MIQLLFFIVCFGASVAGAICGIGGGVIIKPVLDALGVLGVSTISFLSGCTVLSMTTYSVIRSKRSGEGVIDPKLGLPLAIGAAVGGLLGKELFSWVKALSPDPERVGMVQAFCLLMVTIATLIYTLLKKRIRTYHMKNYFGCVVIGLFLGLISSFLGIGGGPINLIVLFYFFSMTTKEAAENSLYIIFFSQAANLISTLVTGKMPQFAVSTLLLMVLGGILGGICGRSFNKRMREETVNQLFIVLMVVMILINIFNIYKFW